MLFQLPQQCRVYTALQPAVQWGWNEILTNKMVYLLDTLVWMKTKDAAKKAPQNRPRMFVPDFLPQQSPEGEISKGAEIHTTEDIDAILARNRG